MTAFHKFYFSVSVVLDAKVTLSSAEKIITNVASEIDAAISFESSVNADFSSLPANYCATFGHSDAVLK